MNVQMTELVAYVVDVVQDISHHNYNGCSTVLPAAMFPSQMITRQSDGMSGVAGDFDDSDSDAASDSYVDLEGLQPMHELSFSQVSWLPSCPRIFREEVMSPFCKLHMLCSSCCWYTVCD